MNLTRRLFSALIPAAPVGVAAARSGLVPPPPTYPPSPIPVNPTMGMIAEKSSMLNRVVREVAPPAYKKYLEARQMHEEMRHFRYRLRDRMDSRSSNIDPDIAALKSVPMRHKVHMQLKKDDDERKQEQSFMEALAESLGLKEYLEKRSTLGGYGDDAPATVASRY